MAWVIEQAKCNIYVDGACRNNQKDNNVGAWAFVVYIDKERIGSKSKSTFNTTNNIQELEALYHALVWANRYGKSVTIHCDSQYVVDTVTKWMFGWRAKGWKKADGTVPKNLDLIKNIMEVYNKDKHTIVKVKGHSGEQGNEDADNLVNVAMDELILNSEFSPLNLRD